METTGRRSLQDLIDAAGGNVVSFLRGNRSEGSTLSDFERVPAQFSHWIEETQAWRRTVVLFDQSYHMTNLIIEGPDTLKLMERVGVNTFRNFGPGRAKQLVVCNYDGYVIRDAVLFWMGENRVKLVARPPALNWVQFHAETGKYDVMVERDEGGVFNVTGRRKYYRYQLQGPKAFDLLRKLTGGNLREIPFFHVGEIQIGQRRVWALHHGMAGVAGMELFGPWEEAEEVKAAILEAGQEFGLKQAGHRAYNISTVESGWVPLPLPAIFTGEKMRPYREWLPADSFEARGSLGGSFVSENIEDYYLNPWDLGYGHLVKFDHDFIGREALESMSKNPRRTKVTLVWNSEDVVKIYQSLFLKPPRAKMIELPFVGYATWQYDKVLNQQGELIGFSTYGAYTANESAILTIGVVNVEYSRPGTEVVIIWGEEGSPKPNVEEHIPVEVRAIVGPVPYSEAARAYRASVIRR
jgi:vanillate/3-O-methylgallate O-demethylase